ncbi:MAG: selenide, water dikinase SelD [Myxococcota bacterium]|nr:selenide, water dikinase SelD [Myxococcota bacterium]
MRGSMVSNHSRSGMNLNRVKQSGHDSPPLRDLVLVGGGHAHVQVLRRFMMKPMPEVRLTVVVDRYEAVYSGMVPGVVAGDYQIEDLTLDILPLARRAGARCVLAKATGIDLQAKQVEVEGRPPIPFDIASLDVGSTVRELSGSKAWASGLATRPISDFVRHFGTRIKELARSPGSSRRVTVVGGGAAGVELALCTEARLRGLGCTAHVEIIAGSKTLLPGKHQSLVRRIEKELVERGIRVRLDTRVVAAVEEGVVLSDDDSEQEIVQSDLTLLATGAAAPAFLKDSGLPTDEEGFVRIRSTLQVEGCDDLFAAGDCARLIDHPWVPRAGVYAVRSGPYLDRNIRARFGDRPLRAWKPQRDFLALLNAGEKRAVGGKWGMALAGSHVWRIKDWIDRRFMKRFQVLGGDGRPNPFFPGPEDMAESEEMICGGCAAKVGPSPLHAALSRLDSPAEDASVLVGLAEADDAAVLKWPGGDIMLASVDAFRAFVDDPFLVGRVATINAVSDVVAKGALARHALALVTVPAETPGRESESLYQTLAGVRAGLDPLGISLVGGHSTTGPELFVGLCITGEPASEGHFLGLSGLSPGDVLILTKPLGTGVLLAGDAQGLVRGVWLEEGLKSMLRHNADAAKVALDSAVSVCTDVSGFGLAGHMLEMLEASGVAAEVFMSELPVLPGVVDLVRRGVTSTFHHQNVTLSDHVGSEGSEVDPARLELLFDPQTSGGLLMATSSEKAAVLLEELRAGGDSAASIIGRVVESDAAKPRIRVSFTSNSQ